MKEKKRELFWKRGHSMAVKAGPGKEGFQRGKKSVGKALRDLSPWKRIKGGRAPTSESAFSWKEKKTEENFGKKKETAPAQTPVPQKKPNERGADTFYRY